VLDLSEETGQRRLAELASRSHALITNLRPVVIRKLGLTYEALQTVNPKLVCVALTGYGLNGPYSDRPAYDYVIQALTGVMALGGEPGATPMRTAFSVADNSTGIMGAFGVVAKLVEGRGGQIDIAMYDVMLSQLNYLASAWLNAGERPTRQLSSAHPYIVPAQTFETLNGWIVLFITHERFWRIFCEAVGRPEWLADERFASMAARTEHREVVISAIADLLRMQTTESWTNRLLPLGVVAAPVETLERALESEHTKARDMVVTLNSGEGPIRVIGNPIKATDYAGAYSAPPTLHSSPEDEESAVSQGTERQSS
jgi:CoA:oxalate CoA-transferase